MKRLYKNEYVRGRGTKIKLGLLGVCYCNTPLVCHWRLQTVTKKKPKKNKKKKLYNKK